MTYSQCTCCGNDYEPTVELLSHWEVKICYNCLNWLNSARERQKKSASSGARVTGVEMIFRVSGVAQSVDHYQRLGFETEFHDETYAFASRDECTIHLAHAGAPELPGKGNFYLHVDDAELLASEWRMAGLEVVGTEDYDYGKREGSHVDPDGNMIRFGSPVPG
jgi:catechol 2,3-dioxygenase-like lactoylglutathione lyase family enzyme